MTFINRRDAGRQLARQLQPYAADRPIVLALPRGGLPVAAEVARVLGAPLDVLVVRKLGAPFQPELGLGAVAEGGAEYLDEESCASYGISTEEMAIIREREQREIERRVRRYRGERAPLDLAGRTVIVVDDGVATGGTARAAIRAVRAKYPARVVFAAPVAAVEAARALAEEADDLVTVEIPRTLWAIGSWYEEFPQVTDDEVIAVLEGEVEEALKGRTDEEEVEIPVAGVVLRGNLTTPSHARGIVIFAHGSGSSRLSPRNRLVARRLNRAGLATLLTDLLTTEEEALDEQTGELRFDIGFLSTRLVEVARWVESASQSRHLRIGLFGSSTGAAAALIASVNPSLDVGAIVSRGGRPDLARRFLPQVRAPTLLIVGSADADVLQLNQAAYAALRCEKDLAIVAGATHLFEEPGALEEVANLAADWFARHLPATIEEARP